MSGMRRPKEHGTPSVLKKSQGTHKGNWIKQLLDLGLTPEIVVLEKYLTEEALVEGEAFWIAYFRFVGCNLTNATNGGVGRLGCGHTPSADARTKISNFQKAAWSDPVHHRKMAAAHGGRPFCDETGRIYRTLREASQFLGVDKTNICACLNNRRKTAGGHTFAYIQKEGVHG